MRAVMETEPKGSGTLYREDGTVFYQGGFSGGLYEGEGSLYDEAGSLVYAGGFSGGLYEGEGKLPSYTRRPPE